MPTYNYFTKKTETSEVLCMGASIPFGPKQTPNQHQPQTQHFPGPKTTTVPPTTTTVEQQQ